MATVTGTVAQIKVAPIPSNQRSLGFCGDCQVERPSDKHDRDFFLVVPAGERFCAP
jgi:hypothetical protein